MAAVTSAVKSAPPNRRRRVRHKIQSPAYATFTGDSKGAMLDLHEILNISEEGVSIQCDSQLEAGRRINLCLDLAESPDHIYTTGQVIWSTPTGRSGLRFAELPPISLFRLREWLFFNAMSAVATAHDAGVTVPFRQELGPPPRPSYTDTLAAMNAVQREVEALGSDLPTALQLIATRVQTLIHASGVAIALIDRDPQFVVCRASSGDDAPPVGARLQVGSGFSGECVHSGMLLRCDDAEHDSRVDQESCRALGIRSMLAVPVRTADKSIGILEAFSARPHAFGENEERLMQRLSDTISAAINRAARAENLPQLPPVSPSAMKFTSTPGSVLFASESPSVKKSMFTEGRTFNGISLPRSHLILLIASAAAIFMALGYLSAPLIAAKLRERGRVQLQTVLASSQAPKPDHAKLIDVASLDQLREMADKGEAAAQYTLGLRYAVGEGVMADDHQALNWFTKAAEQGYIPAESKLGSFYYNGRGVPQNFNEAYRWAVLARASGDDTSKTLVPLVAQHLTREQTASIELDANRWLQQHSAAKPAAAR